MADSDHQSRSSQALAGLPGETPDLFGEGVGGRQPETPFPQEGGGYPEIRGFSNFRANDARIQDLRKMGLPAVQLRAAETVGVDAFLAIWRIFDSDPSCRTDKGDIELRMRPYRSYLRYQRNRYIEQLTAMGYNAPTIREMVQLHLCERISLRNVYHVISKDYYRQKAKSAIDSEPPRQTHLSLVVDQT